MEFIKIAKEGHVALVTISNPPVNVLTFPVLDELSAAMEDLAADKEVWALVLNSDQKIFSAGADAKNLGKVDRAGNLATSDRMQQALLKVENFPHPVICAVHGNIMGGGLELALCADLRVFDEKTKCAFPETGLGITPGAGGTQRLTKLVGAGVAKRMIYTGEMVPAAEALALGICEYVAEEGKVTEKAMEVAQKICTKGPLAVAVAKKCIDYATENPLLAGLKFENETNSALFESEDRIEGITAMFEKRKAEFKNQ